ncbi:uncharacterized protein EV422DRAFT_563845 [Fimicolochytrium jonesii]|uniref:uncharacterized protein n=1 Tax=Fimicolochytrium jonesii TaxID=1396493 RepID=UPI0022FE054F|nr:uncharacterized protein EV422DRAFT_563845 [Fimicolochytrium jonesii]KAI8826030.1 hypothetical protein EV422DRAFT_563845 [Fimicolochytrium jonesii]
MSSKGAPNPAPGRPPPLPASLDTKLTRTVSASSSLASQDAGSDADISASKYFTRALASTVDAEEMAAMVRTQETTGVTPSAQTFLTPLLDISISSVNILRDTSLTLERFNRHSASRYAHSVSALALYTKMMKTMHADLEVVFRRIRALRARVAGQYPEHSAHVARQRAVEEAKLDVE